MATWSKREKLNNLLAQMPPGLRERLAKTTLGRAKILANIIRPRIPVDTGEARSTLEVYPGGAPGTKESNLGMSVAVDITEGNPKNQPGEHVRYLEFGTKDMRARPHFFPSFRLERANIRRAWRRTIRLFLREQSKL